VAHYIRTLDVNSYPAHQQVLPMAARLIFELSCILSLHLKAGGRAKQRFE
jgi:hypothetical protein